jgi:Yos1-like
LGSVNRSDQRLIWLVEKWATIVNRRLHFLPMPSAAVQSFLALRERLYTLAVHRATPVRRARGSGSGTGALKKAKSVRSARSSQQSVAAMPTLGMVFKSLLLVVNACAVLHEERFLRKGTIRASAVPALRPARNAAFPIRCVR